MRNGCNHSLITRFHVPEPQNFNTVLVMIPESPSSEIIVCLIQICPGFIISDDSILFSQQAFFYGMFKDKIKNNEILRVCHSIWSNEYRYRNNSFYTVTFESFPSASVSFLQNLKRAALCSSIFSTSSIGSPFVSGTQISTKNKAITDITPNIRKVHEVPIASVSDRNDCATIRLDIQFAVAAIPPQTPLNLRGYISEFTIHGTVPIPGEKKMIYSAKPIRASHPNRLGHPLVYHSLFSPWHRSFTVELEIKHAPGYSCNCEKQQ